MLDYYDCYENSASREKPFDCWKAFLVWDEDGGAEIDG
jgi:hypothetical protein